MLKKLSSNIFSISVFMFVTLALSACGGGGGNSQTITSPITLKTGVLIDSPVANISYQTASQAGTTNTNGEFTYKERETVTFSIGPLVFPSVNAQQIITPLTLAGAVLVTDPQAINIARLLQSLDEDGDPANGITIPSDAALAASSIDFDIDTTAFEKNPNVINLVANSGSVTTTLVSVVAAQDHVTETLFNAGIIIDANEGTLVPFKPVEIFSDVSYSGTISATIFDTDSVPVLGQSFYSFTATSDSVYTISLTNVYPEGANLGWTLYSLDINDTKVAIATCDNDGPNFKEVCETPQLTKDVVYLIQVGNTSSIGVSYNLLASTGVASAPVIENEGSTAFPVKLTIQLKHEGTISENGISVYSFTIVATIPYTISLINVNPLGVDLDWELYDSNNNYIDGCINDVANGNELCTTADNLVDNSIYKIYVYNNDLTEPATFDLKVY